MNLQESRNMKLFAETFPDPHMILVSFMNAAKTAQELAIPLHAYGLVYPNSRPPETPLFRSAQSIIDNALYNETVSFGLSLGISRQHLETVAGAPPVLVLGHGPRDRRYYGLDGHHPDIQLRPGDVPRAKLTTDYNLAPPSDAARQEARAKREKDGGSTGLTGSVLKKHPEKVERFDTRYPRHWSA